VWLNFWVELDSAADRDRYKAFLDNYVMEQKKLGRFPRPLNNRLSNIEQWLDVEKVVRDDTRIQMALSIGFLLVCLINTIGLLLAKFSVRAPEVGVRRALGASRKEIFTQFLIESAVVGLVGGLLGLALAIGALSLIGSISEQIAVTTKMDWVMLLVTFVMSVSAAVLAGLLPTWRACQVTPAIQLKSQ